MDKTIRIGTRNSPLALWQANQVKKKLEYHGYKTQLISITSTGDLLLNKPLYELGITGIFTKTLDVAMINGTVDIAVHSMKDVPTALPKGIIQAAVLKRADVEDIIVTKNIVNWENSCTIATGSLRRKAQWLHKYPHHNVVNLRGNVQTRLQKLKDHNWQGAIFAKAGLDRMEYLKKDSVLNENFKGWFEDLKWMVPAPAQGTMMVAAMKEDSFCLEALSKLNHKETEITTGIERDFLKTLEGGCTAPIGALATIKEKTIEFIGSLFSLDGRKKLEVVKTIPVDEHKDFGKKCAQIILNNGGEELMKSIKNSTHH